MSLKRTLTRALFVGSAVCTLGLVTVSEQSGVYAQDQATLGEIHASQNLSLRDALRIGVQTNPEYGVVASSRRATDEELEQGKALFLPSLDLNADAGFEHSDDPSSRAGTGGDTENLLRFESGLTLTQLLFDGWESKYEVERQKARVRSAAFRVNETAELVGLAIVEAYLEVVRQRQLLLIARRNVAEHVAILDLIQDGVDGGRSTASDLAQVEARLAASRASTGTIAEDLRIAEALYKQEVGDFPGELTLPETPFDALSETVEEEVKLALAHSPTIGVFEADIETAYAESEQTKSTFYPQVDLQLNARQGHNLGGFRGRDRSATAFVVVNWNLYRGGGDQARAREFIHRHQQEKEERAEAAREIENNVRSTWASMISSGERARQFAAQADANVEVVKAYKDQFNLGRRTLLDVLDAQNELFVSRSDTVNAAFLEMFAVFNLLALKGALMPAYEIEYPREGEIASHETWTRSETEKAY